MTTSPKKKIEKIIGFKLPVLCMGKDWAISFYAYDPITDQMRRKMMKINHVPIKQRKLYAQLLIKNLTEQLIAGWNPWIEESDTNYYKPIPKVAEHFQQILQRQYASNVIRKETFSSYTSYLKILEEYHQNNPVKYILKMDRAYLLKFLDYIVIDRKAGLRTRDNYLGFLRAFSSFLLEYSYVKEKPTEGITRSCRNRTEKQRTVIPDEVRARMKVFLLSENKFMLLACQILYYCFIRPSEMAKLKIGDINFQKSTIFLGGEISKNRKNAVVTIPKALMELMLELCIPEYDASYYLFSDGMIPGPNKHDEKQFRDYWNKHMRKPLQLKSEYKFYSLKDTGITNMLKNNVDVLSVRDQARHYSIVVTDTYTPHDMKECNDIVRSIDVEF